MKSWLDYVSGQNRYPNLKVAAEAPYMGLTIFYGKKPWLVIGKDHNKYIIEDENGKVLKVKGPLDYKNKTNKSALIAASRSEDNPIPRGNLFYDQEWDIKLEDKILPIEQMIDELDSIGWSKAEFKRLTHEVGERKDEKTDPLSCPSCQSHTVELTDKEASKFHCFSCGKEFSGDVYFNPKSHIAYEVDRGNDWKPYAPGPDDPKKITCSCGYSWRSHHEFQVTGGKCPQCGATQSDVMAYEGQTPPIHHSAIGFPDVPEWETDPQLLEGPLAPPRQTEDQNILKWRLQQFLQMGFDPQRAQELAQSKIDWHEIQNLVNRGANPEVAVSILSKATKNWKEDYDYRDAADPKFSCGTCFFFSKGHCNMFDDEVEADYTCDAWQSEKKESKVAALPRCLMCGNEDVLLGDNCPTCNKTQTTWRYDRPPKKTLEINKAPAANKWAKLNFDQNGNELVVGKPYYMYSPKYKIPDVVYIVKAEPNIVEAAI